MAMGSRSSLWQPLSSSSIGTLPLPSRWLRSQRCFMSMVVDVNRHNLGRDELGHVALMMEWIGASPSGRSEGVRMEGKNGLAVT